jgi:HK97 gp10 family phage protein
MSKVEGFKEVSADLQKMGTETIDKLKRCLIAGGNAIQMKARQGAPVNTGHLRESIIVVNEFAKGELNVTIGPTLEYGAYMEFGTTPHVTSKGHEEFVESIKRWAHLHNMPWYPVYRKIVREGTKAKPFLVPAYNVVAPKVEKQLDKILADIK